MSRAAIILALPTGLKFPCWRKNEANVRSFFADYPRIKVCPVDSEAEMLSLLDFDGAERCGYYKDKQKPDGVPFDRWFYQQLGLEYEFQIPGPIPTAPIPEEEVPVPHYGPYAFVANRNVDLRTDVSMPIVKPDPEKLLLSHRRLIRDASEIHVVSTCWLPFVNQLQPGCPKFFHRYARSPRPEDNPTVWGPGWTILD